MKTQMEMTFESSRTAYRPAARRRVPGARWWFQQMHAVVDSALEWKAPAARPEQVYLDLPQRSRKEQFA